MENQSEEINIGVFTTNGKGGNAEILASFTQEIITRVQDKLNAISPNWFFDFTDSEQLESDNAREPSDFLDSASLRMAEGPYDLLIVVTDVPLKSRKNILQAGLYSKVARIIVISTRKLTTTGKKQSPLHLDQEIVKQNGEALLLHLIGHVFGLKHNHKEHDSVMSIIDFPSIDFPTGFSQTEKRELQKNVPKGNEKILRKGNILQNFGFHLLMILQNPINFFEPIFRNKAFFLPLRLPGLATAAVAPGLLLVFTAEIWDVGFGMTNSTAIYFAVISIICASLYLVNVQTLFLPRKEKKVLTEHLAVANGVIFFSVFLACFGLFVMMVALMLFIELYIFPSGLMQTWPTLEHGNVILSDKVRLAVFISTVCVITGALAGGMENKRFLHHLALFSKRV
ncbi:MAG TPA: hypothetical protein VFM82_06565 [Flavobacteriaceae bacterium]|nr:hypothetical protein [Flavobacteriaceae bacterium]